MAKSALRIRFVFSAQEADVYERSGRQRFGQRFTNALVEDFAFQYAEDTYRTMAGQIEARIQKDVRRELRHLAALFRHHIIGAAPSNNRPAGFLSTLSQSELYGEQRVSIRSSLPPWAARSDKYLSYKQRKVQHRRWWEYNGDLASAMTAESWVTSFGPINIQFQRAHRPRNTAYGTRFQPNRTPAGAKIRVAIGTIRVYALSYITPEMLPALRSGDPETMNSDQGNSGLMNLVQNGMGDDIAYRLGRRSSRATGNRYRPTLEPFLAFFLTRSVPVAIARRLEINRLGRPSLD